MFGKHILLCNRTNIIDIVEFSSESPYTLRILPPSRNTLFDRHS